MKVIRGQSGRSIYGQNLWNFLKHSRVRMINEAIQSGELPGEDCLTWFKVNKLITHITQDGFVFLFTFNLFVTWERGWWRKKNYCIVTYKNKLIFVLLQGNNQEYSRPPMVRVDPERRCSVMLIYGTHLVVLPFRQEGILDDHDVAYTGR